MTNHLRIKNIQARDGGLGLLINEGGKGNYFILKKNSKASTGKTVHLPNLELINFSLSFSDHRTDLIMAFEIEAIRSSVLYAEPEVFFSVSGNLVGKFLGLGGLEFEGDKPIELDANLKYNRQTHILEISPSSVSISKSLFEIKGTYQIDESRDLEMTIDARKTDLLSLISLLPEKYSVPLEAYESQGEVLFRAEISGALADPQPAQLEVRFRGDDVSFFHPDYQTRIEELSFAGSFQNGVRSNLESTSFSIKEMSGKLGNRGFTGSLELVDLSNPHISLRLETEQELEKLLDFYPVEKLKQAKGNLQIDITLDGRLNDLKDVKTATNFSTSGQLSLKKVSLQLDNIAHPFEALNGDLIFNKNDLAISDLHGHWGQTDFLVSGLFKNVLRYLFFENQQLVIQAQLDSKVVELEEILSSGPGENEEYQLNISPDIEIVLDCQVAHLIFQRFSGRDFKGEILIQDQTISAPNLSFKSAGGKVRAAVEATAGIRIDAQHSGQTWIHSRSSVEGIYIDSVFYVFKNFNQDFLVDSHLEGQIDADLNTMFVLDEKLRLIAQTLFSEVSFSIREGELNDFEPMEKLTKYIKHGDLSRLKFSELKNNLIIQDRTVFIPKMEIHSNVSNISIQGSHTFNQLIDYKLKVPLSNKPKKEQDEMFGAIEEDASGRANLFLTIKGTTDDYKIAYDKRAVAHKIKEDIKGEGQELVETFKEKGKKEEAEVVLEEDEFFDFEEDDH